jgi:hypothetical protein
VNETEAIILDAVVAPGHDGAAELVVSLRHPNGGLETVALDAELGFHLMKCCGVSSAADLPGKPWQRILEGL